jgi:hypothetical protein
MTYDRPPAYLPATPEYILAVIRDSHRQQCQFDSEANPDVELTFETTIAEWRETCDLIEWSGLGRALDDIWNLGRADEAWRAVLEPDEERTLRDLCEFIAPGAVRPTIEALKILGATCLPAGAFLAIRSLLHDAGVDTDPVMPSTPLGEYARRHLGVFLGPISRLAPNALPAVKVSTPWHNLCFACLLLAMLVLAGSFFIGPFATTAGVILGLTSYAGLWICALLRPSKVIFGNLRTFGDLARVIAAGAEAG